jgi:muconolactone D-isomerase
MQFLIITKQTNPPPPEMVIPLVEAMKAWMAANRASGKSKAIWSFAGTPGGGGIFDVDSHDELDELMIGFPFGPFSSIEVFPLADIDQTLEVLKANFEKMMAMMGGQ